MNRFIIAKELNKDDELMWKTKHQGNILKCIWKNCSPNLTFIAFKIENGQVLNEPYRAFSILNGTKD